MARISTYDQNKDYDKLADEYLATCGREQTKLPKISEFCRKYVGADEDTVNEWINGRQIPEGANVDELHGVIKKIKEAQKQELMDDGLFGGKECNVAMAIFLLKVLHGYIDTSRQELVGKDGQPLQISIKLDMAGGYIPQVGATFTTPAADTAQSNTLQNTSMAPQSKKNDNSNNGDREAGTHEDRGVLAHISDQDGGKGRNMERSEDAL